MHTVHVTHPSNTRASGRRRRRSAIAALLASLITVPAALALDMSPVSADIPPPPPSGSGGNMSAGYLHPLTPARLLDTREGVGASGKVGPGASVQLQVTGRGGVPANAGAVVLNVTVTDPTASGFVTVYPTGSKQPEASNLNFRSGQTVPNLVVVKLGAGGKVTLLNSHGESHLVADVMGWYDDIFSSFPSIPKGGSRQQGIAPVRLTDTRQHGGPLGPGGELVVPVAGRHGIPKNATAVALNVTVTAPTSAGFLTVYPSDAARPDASNLNFSPDQTVPNMVIAKLGADGAVRLFNSHGSTHVVVDATAYFTPADQLLGGGELNAVQPARVLDTREGLGAPAGKVGPGQTISVKVAGEGGVPDMNVDSVVLNVTVTDPTSGGFVTAFPSGSARPDASNLNFTPGLTVPNLVIAKVGADGRVNLYNSHGTTHLIADVTGFFNADAPVSLPPGVMSGEQSGGAAGTEVALTAASATEDDPEFAAKQAAFWEDHDPREALTASDPEGLLERGAPLTSEGALTEHGNDAGVKYQIWSQGYSYPNYSKAIGRLVFWDPGRSRWTNCTATMVARNLAVTAAHCVVDGGGWSTNLAFFAGLQGNVAHGGIYTNVVNTITPGVNGDVAYLTDTYSWAADYAFVQFGPTNGRYPGDITGWFGMQIHAPVNWLLSYGYPSEGSYFGRYCSSPRNQMDAACYMYQTWGRYGGYQQYAQGWYEIGWGSDMTGGSSGGPVFSYDGSQYRIVSVNSNGRSEFVESSGARGFVLNMWGPYFNRTLLDLYNAYVVR